jgi:ABC-type transport system substrate-binding protein
MSRRRTGLVALAVALAVLACESCSLPDKRAPSAAAAAGTAAVGGTLTVATLPSGSLDPAALTDATSSPLSSLLCDTLVNLDPKTGEPKPALAESFVVTEGGRGVVVKLRRGLTFTDGTRFDSRQVVNSLRRVIRPETASPMAELLRPVAGFEAYRKSAEDGDEKIGALTGIRIIEPYSFEFVLNAPDHDFVRSLAHPALAPVVTGAAERDPEGFGRVPVCVGPYKAASPVALDSTEVRLRRWDRYRGSTPALTNAGRGWAAEIVVRTYPNADAAYQAWERGEVQVSPVAPERVADALRAHPEAITSAPGSHIEYLGLPFGADSPFNDLDVRRTLAAAIDRQQLVDAVYGRGRIPAAGFLPPTVGTPAMRDCAYSLPNHPVRLPTRPVKLYFNDEFVHRRLVEEVARQWRAKLGLDVQPVALNWDQYLQKATTGAGFDGAFRMSWTPLTLTVVSYTRPLFHSSRIGATNLSRFSDRNVDHILDQELAAAADDGDRDLLLTQVIKRACEKVAMIPLAISESHFAVDHSLVRAARADGRVVSPEGVLMLRELAAQKAGPA